MNIKLTSKDALVFIGLIVLAALLSGLLNFLHLKEVIGPVWIIFAVIAIGYVHKLRK